MAKAVYVTQESMEADLCQDFKFFRDLFWETVPGAGQMKYNWHLDVFCDEAQTVIERVAKGLPREYDLVVNVPPGTSKSTVFSILLPAWAWIRWPWMRFLSASHTDALVLDLANKSRSVIKSDKYQKLFPHIILKEDQDAKGYFANTLGGDRFTCTAAGKSPIGRHAHVQLLDDLTDPKKALSQLSLETCRAFVDEELISRKVDKAVSVTVLIMQRLGVGDPTDVMVKGAEREGAAPVRHIVLPSDLDKMSDGRFKLDDVKPEYLANRYVDGLLDPVRMSQTTLSEFRARGDHYFSTQFRQKPYSKKGGMFREEYFDRRIKSAPYEARRIRFWDFAASSEEMGGCRTAGVLMCEAEMQVGQVKLRKWYVEDVVVGQWEPYERNQKVKATALRDRVKYGPAHEPVIFIEREGGSSGKEVMQFIVQFLAGFNVREYNPSRAGSKERRAENWSAELAAGNVYLVDDGGQPKWDITGFVDEHVSFPLAPYKDRVDAAAGAFLNLVSGKRDMGIPGKIVHALGERSKTHRIRIIVCNMDQMPDLQFEEPWVLVQLCNPEPCRQLTLPGHDPRMVGCLMLEFCDMEPALMQDRWTLPVEPYNKPPSELIPKQEHGKKLWAFLTKKRDPAPWVYVVQGPPGDDMRAQSVAFGICDALRLRREETIWHLGATDFVAREDEQPGLKHLYDTVRSTRHLVG